MGGGGQFYVGFTVFARIDLDTCDLLIPCVKLWRRRVRVPYLGIVEKKQGEIEWEPGSRPVKYKTKDCPQAYHIEHGR